MSQAEPPLLNERPHGCVHAFKVIFGIGCAALLFYVLVSSSQSTPQQTPPPVAAVPPAPDPAPQVDPAVLATAIANLKAAQAAAQAQEVEQDSMTTDQKIALMSAKRMLSQNLPKYEVLGAEVVPVDHEAQQVTYDYVVNIYVRFPTGFGYVKRMASIACDHYGNAITYLVFPDPSPVP